MLFHPALHRSVPHHRLDKNEHFDPWRDDGRGPKDPTKPARRRPLARALLVLPTLLFLPIALGIDPGWGRFIACVGLLLLGILVVVTWSDPVRPRRLALQALYVGGIAAYTVTLFP